MPQSMSRVIALSFSPSLSIWRVKFWTFGRQWSWVSTHSMSRSLKGAQLKEVVFRPAYLRRGTADAALQVQEVGGIEGLATGIALVASGPGIGAIGTRTFNVAVGEVAVTAGAVGEHHPIFVDVLLGKKVQEDILHDLLVVRSTGRGEEVEGDAHPVPGLEEEGLELVHDLLGGYAFFLGAEGNWGAVLVAARDHQDLVALGAMVSGEYICGEVGPGQVAQV